MPNDEKTHKVGICGWHRAAAAALQEKKMISRPAAGGGFDPLQYPLHQAPELLSTGAV